MTEDRSLPAPPLPADADLRDFVFMPLDVVRLRDSGIAVHASGDGFRAAVLLWCASWHQLPAASLPDDDAILAQLAGYGRVVKEWKKVRAEAMRGWFKCADGLLYHPVVVEKAIEAWTQKQDHRARREAERKRKAEERERRRLEEEARNQAGQSSGNPAENGGLSGGHSESVRRTDGGNPAENALKGEGEGEGEVRDRERDIKPSSGGAAPNASPSAPPAAKSTNGSRLPADWVLPKAWGEWALSEQPTWTADHVRKVADIFRDYWVGKAGADARKTDWQATWRNWVRKEKPIAQASPIQGSSAKFDPVSFVNQNRTSRSSHAPGEIIDVQHEPLA